MTEEDPFWCDLFAEVQHDVRLSQGCKLLLRPDRIAEQLGIPGRWYYQIECERPDAITGEIGVGRSSKAYLSPFANRTELVQTALGLYKGYWNHETHEGFWYRSDSDAEFRQVFGPHIDVTYHWEVAKETEHRG